MRHLILLAHRGHDCLPEEVSPTPSPPPARRSRRRPSWRPPLRPTLSHAAGKLKTCFFGGNSSIQNKKSGFLGNLNRKIRFYTVFQINRNKASSKFTIRRVTCHTPRQCTSHLCRRRHHRQCRRCHHRCPPTCRSPRLARPRRTQTTRSSTGWESCFSCGRPRGSDTASSAAESSRPSSSTGGQQALWLLWS